MEASGGNGHVMNCPLTCQKLVPALYGALAFGLFHRGSLIALRLQSQFSDVVQGAAKKVAPPQSFLPFSRQLFGVLSIFFYKFIY